MPDSPEVHPEYLLIFRALTAQGIRFCSLRDDLDDGRLSADLDLLVDDERFEDALSTLETVGYRVKTTERLVPFKTVLLKYTDGVFITIDLHRRLVQNGIVYMDHREVLQRRRAVGPYFLPADADLLAILVFHNVLGKGRIQSKHYPQICRLIESADRETLEAVVTGNGTQEIFGQIINEIDGFYREPERVERARSELVQSLSRFDRGLRRRRIIRRIRHGWRRFDPRPRGRLYACVGVDGSGKTSLCRALRETLNQQGAFSAVSVYMGPWGSYSLRLMRGEPYVPGWSLTTGEWLGALFRHHDGEKPSLKAVLTVTAKAFTGAAVTEQQRARHRLVREHSRLYLTLRYLRSQVTTLRFFVMLTAEMCHRYWKVYRYLRRRRIVIADRYIYDLMTGGMHQVIPHYRRMRRLLCRLFFRPHRTFLLRNDPDAILARKQDLSRESLQEFQAIYDNLAEEYGFEVLQTDRSPELLARGLVERYFDELVRAVRG